MFGYTPGAGDEQGSLVCCSPWGRRVGHDWVTEQQYFQNSHFYSVLLWPTFDSSNGIKLETLCSQNCFDKTDLDPDLSQNIEEEETLSNSFEKVSLPLITKPARPPQKSKWQANIPDEHRCKNPQKNINKMKLTTEKNHRPWSSGIYSREARTVKINNK